MLSSETASVRTNFLRYRIYRNRSPHPTTLVDSLSSRVTAVDSAGNESLYSDEVNAAPNGLLAVEELNAFTPKEYSLSQNYPNPFNPSTVIRYGVPARSKVTLEIFNILGQLVARLVDDVQDPRFYETTWHAEVPSGLYFWCIQAVEVGGGGKKFVDVKRMVLVK